jgi:hypothetical protein
VIIRVHVCIFRCICIYSGSGKDRTFTYIHTYAYIYICTYLYHGITKHTAGNISPTLTSNHTYTMSTSFCIFISINVFYRWISPNSSFYIYIYISIYIYICKYINMSIHMCKGINMDLCMYTLIYI